MQSGRCSAVGRSAIGRSAKNSAQPRILRDFGVRRRRKPVFGNSKRAGSDRCLDFFYLTSKLRRSCGFELLSSSRSCLIMCAAALVTYRIVERPSFLAYLSMLTTQPLWETVAVDRHAQFCRNRKVAARGQMAGGGCMLCAHLQQTSFRSCRLQWSCRFFPLTSPRACAIVSTTNVNNYRPENDRCLVFLSFLPLWDQTPVQRYSVGCQAWAPMSLQDPDESGGRRRVPLMYRFYTWCAAAV
jgi:hypothetical protein